MNFGACFLLTLLFVYFVLIPATTFLDQERRYRLRWRWRQRVRRSEPAPGGPFRDEESGRVREYVVERHGAPRVVKVVAVASLVLGHMFIPGLFAGLFGLPFYGLGLMSIPGLVLAARIYGNAYGLLRCEPAAAIKARELQHFANVLNVVVLVATELLLMIDTLPIFVFIAVYALVSLLHAHGLGLAADAIDAVHRDELEVVPELPARGSALRVA
ncbi:MAG: hypothetical protein AAGF11_36665 [Myxococcota bacterium]